MKNTCTTLVLLLATASLFAQWKPVPSLPGAGTDGCFAATVNGKAYVGGGVGRNTLYEYDPVSSSWTKKANIPGPMARAWSGSFAADGKVYIIGGDSTFGGLLDDVWMFDPVSNTYSRKADFPGGRRDGMFSWTLRVGSETRVYVGGGFDGHVILADFYEYIPSTDTWKKLPGGLPSPMLFASTFVISNKGYVTLWEGGAFYNQLWEFDPSGNTWTEKTACPATARGEGIGVTINGRGIAGMGQTNFEKAYTDLYSYNPSTDKWTMIKDTFPAAHSAWSCAFSIGNSLYAGTGATLPDFNFSNKFYRYDMVFAGTDEPVQQSPFIIYPNPADDEFHIGGSIEGIQKAEVSDLQGRCLISLSQPEETVSLKELGNGVYMVSLYTSSGVFNTKLIISRHQQ